jgi:crotonobetainyl-CoA hydratase
MVLGCDIVVAAEHARFGLPEPRVGRVPLDGGVVQLCRHVPFRSAMAMLLTGRQVTAVEALAIGLINEVTPGGQLDAAVQRWVEDVLACAPLALRAIKQMLHHTSGMSPQQAARLRLPALVQALESSDADEGVRAFQQKRKPQWKGS